MKCNTATRGETGFHPKFGAKGELRQPVGQTGRAHLDRWLPFLVLNRSPAPDESIARRVAINSPAYLIWSPKDDDAAATALDAIVAELRDRLGPVLLISVEDEQAEPQEEDSPTLPRFLFRVAAEGSERAERALKAMCECLEKIEIELRPAEVEQTGLRLQLNEVKGTERASLSVPQIHRGPRGELYPQVTHELTLAAGDALLRAAAAFMAGTPRAPAHHSSLGRSAFLAAALHADAKLDSIARRFDFLLSLTPINTTEEKSRFFDSGGDRLPEFRYRPLTIDPDEAKSELYAIDLSMLEDPLLERLLRDKRRELDYQLTMLATRNTPSFRAASQLLYGGVQSRLLDSAHAVLESTPPGRSSSRTFAADDVASAARKLVSKYRSNDPRFAAAIEVRDDVAGMLVSGPKLMIGSSTTVGANRLDALLAHEVSVHLLTHFNGSAQGLTIFRTGLAHYEGIQEGLGVFAEWVVGGLTATRLRLLAGRVIAVDAMIDGADFLQVYRRLANDLEFSGRSAFDITMRVFRSGGLSKDAIYLKGFGDVLDIVASGASLEPFWAGKIAPNHVDAVEQLFLRGLLHRPIFLPEFLERKDARRRIDRLREGIKFEQILQVE